MAINSFCIRCDIQMRKKTHLSRKCTCGRRIHFPHYAQKGYVWQCHSCGKEWTLADHGLPLEQTASRPATNKDKQTPYKKFRHTKTSTRTKLITAGLIAWFVVFVLEPSSGWLLGIIPAIFISTWPRSGRWWWKAVKGTWNICGLPKNRRR